MLPTGETGAVRGREPGSITTRAVNGVPHEAGACGERGLAVNITARGTTQLGA